VLSTLKIAATLATAAALALEGCRLGCLEGEDCSFEFEDDPSSAACRSLDCFVPPETASGWDDPPGTGLMFVVNQIAIAGQNRGFDLDGDGTIDNSFWQLGTFSNDQIRQALLGGENLVLIELAGLGPSSTDQPQSLTIKMYDAADADDPIFPANNFKVPPGHTNCCEFVIRATSLDRISRIPAVLIGDHVSTVEPGTHARPFLFDFQRPHISFRFPASRHELAEGLLGGDLSYAFLASTPNPFCPPGVVSPRCIGRHDDTMLGWVIGSAGMRADLDRDGDGLECLSDTSGAGDLVCCDGAGAESCTDASGGCRRAVEPLVAESALSCAMRREMADGISASMTFTALAASAVGVR
jgi:hypothetical protein